MLLLLLLLLLFLLVIGFIPFLIGLLADLVAFNRQLLEATLQKVRSIEFSIQPTDSGS